VAALLFGTYRLRFLCSRGPFGLFAGRPLGAQGGAGRGCGAAFGHLVQLAAQFAGLRI
jgi:hypothetical protein